MRFVTVTFGLSIGLFSFGNEPVQKISQSEYVSMWSHVAIQDMETYRIPASITLAQGILESGNGNSPLAVQANNHFGIKCHEWKGETIFFDDDKKNECFRKYATAADSYKDHSLFLKGKPRYAELFTFPVTDYKSWANGLKKAGYATNPKYPDLLIELIEKLNLNEFDNASPEPIKGSELLANDANKDGVTKDLDSKLLYSNKHTVQEHKNEIKYITAKKGDTYYKISQEFKIGMWQLYKYNDFGPKKDLLEEGDIVYLEPKRNKSKVKNDVLVTKSEMTIEQISQQEGIKVEALKRLNIELNQKNSVPKGQKILLR